jgi:hypothetical protein
VADSEPTDEMLLAWWLQGVIERILSAKYGTKPQVVVQNNQQNVLSVDPTEAAQLYQKTISGG